MTINAVKGVEVGAGFASAALTGSENADEIFMGNEGPRFSSNHAGGILGGISSGQDVVARFAVKPTSSILTPRRTITGHDAAGIAIGRRALGHPIRRRATPPRTHQSDVSGHRIVQARSDARGREGTRRPNRFAQFPRLVPFRPGGSDDLATDCVDDPAMGEPPNQE
jgi:hypothetical protein